MVFSTLVNIAKIKKKNRYLTCPSVWGHDDMSKKWIHLKKWSLKKPPRLLGADASQSRPSLFSHLFELSHLWSCCRGSSAARLSYSPWAWTPYPHTHPPTHATACHCLPQGFTWRWRTTESSCGFSHHSPSDFLQMCPSLTSSSSPPLSHNPLCFHIFYFSSGFYCA